MCRLLIVLMDKVVYIVLCFVVRSGQAVGAAAYKISLNAIIAYKFPKRVGIVFVSTKKPHI